MPLDGRCVLHSPTAFSMNEPEFRSYHSLRYLFRAAAIPSESCLRYHSQLDHLINRSPKRAGTNLNPLFGSIRSNGCGSTNIGDIARQLLITNIRSTRTVQPVSMKSWENELTHPFGASSSASGSAQKRHPLSLQISTIR